MNYDGFENPTLPQWLDEIPNKSRGIDLLGLRNPAQAIGNIFLTGITTATKAIRYFTYRTWAIWAYANWKLPDSYGYYKSFMERVESAFSLSNLIFDKHIAGVIGVGTGTEIAEREEEKIELVNLVQQKAYALYTNPSQQIGLTEESSYFIPAISKERGEVLAKHFDELIKDTKFYKKLKNDPKARIFKRDELYELGKIVRVDKIPAKEADILTESLMPNKPVEGNVNEYYRIGTYSLCLEIAQKEKCVPNETQFFERVVSINKHKSQLIERVRNGWLMYLMRDMLAVVYEKQFQCIHEKVSENLLGVDEERMIEEILSEKEDNIEILKELGIIKNKTSFQNLTFNLLKEKIEEQLISREFSEDLVRWEGSINELKVIELAKYYENISVLIPISWLIIYKRIEEFVKNGNYNKIVSLLSRVQGHLSFVDNLLPTIENFLNNNTSLIKVLEFSIRSTIEQHFKIAWERFDSSNVAILYREGDILRLRLPFKAGQTQSRLLQAIGWLQELELIQKDGLTKKGTKVLENNLQTIKEASIEF